MYRIRSNSWDAVKIRRIEDFLQRRSYILRVLPGNISEKSQIILSMKFDRFFFKNILYYIGKPYYLAVKKTMKHLKRQFKKFDKDLIKKWLSGLVIIFFVMVMLFQKDATTAQLQFVRNADEVFMHNAANTQRDYLFEDEWGQETYQGQIGTGITTPTENTSIDNLINPDEIEQIIGTTQTGTTQTGTIFTGTMQTGTQTTGTQTTGTTYTGSLDCITPWKEKVKNRDFVLAYEQRTDVNTICNIEKRVCMSGTLGWSFTQSSCREDVVYEYKKAEVISYNQKVLNEYIQPNEPINSWAAFNTEGKINETQSPTDTRGTSNSPTTSQPEVEQTATPNKANCITSRGQTIKHGQFVKAYKAPRGFIDLPCEVELRACVNGSLKWTFSNAKCTYNNTTYSEYITAGSPASNTGFLFFERIKKALKFGR